MMPELPRATASTVQVDADQLCSALCTVLDYRALACMNEARRAARGHVTNARAQWIARADTFSRSALVLGAAMYHDERRDASPALEVLGDLVDVALELVPALELCADELPAGDALVDVYLLTARILGAWATPLHLRREPGPAQPLALS